MPTLADVLRQTGYSQDGTLATPTPTESPMTKVLAEHIKSLPQKFNENQAHQMELLGKAFPGNTYESMMTQGDPKAMAELAMQTPFNAMIAYHGSKNIFDKFDPKKIGSASGIDYGYGMYSAEHPEIAKGYGNNLYKIDIPDEYLPKMIDWYSQKQTPEVTEILKKAGLPYNAGGEAITMAAAEKMGGSDATKSGFQKAAEYLNSLGIKGNKYENFQIKNGKGADTFNYVVYDPSEVKILEKNNKPFSRKEFLEQEFNKIAGGEKPIRSAVVMIGDKIFTGNTHTQAFEKAIQEGVIRKEGSKFIYPKNVDIDSDLFMLKDGRIVDRLTASRMLNIGSSEGALSKNMMQIRPAKSMDVKEYKRQAKELKD